MLYARALYNARGEVRFGLRDARKYAYEGYTVAPWLIVLDVLNRYPNSAETAHTVHVMMYIFPRQFGLHNVFTSTVDSRETTQPFKDYLLREEEISKVKHVRQLRRQPESSLGSKSPLINKDKLPKRLRGRVFELSRQLQRRHQRCSYTALIQHYCPVKVLFLFITLQLDVK